MSSIELILCTAAKGGDVGAVLSVWADHPGFNVNWAIRSNQWTALHSASMNGQAEVVRLLLAHPAINFNCKTSAGSTPFFLACMRGQVSVVSVLLKDPRVNVTMADKNGCTPLGSAAREGYHEVIEWLMASGRELGDLNKKGAHWDVEEYTSLEIARSGVFA